GKRSTGGSGRYQSQTYEAESGTSRSPFTVHRSRCSYLLPFTLLFEQPPPIRIDFDLRGDLREAAERRPLGRRVHVHPDQFPVEQQLEPGQTIGTPLALLGLPYLDHQLAPFPAGADRQHRVARLSERLSEVPVQVSTGGLGHDLRKINGQRRAVPETLV